MPNLAEMRGRINAVSTELATLWKKDERSADDESRLDALLAEFNDLGPKIEREAAFEAADKQSGQYRQSAGRQTPAVATDEGQRQEEAKKADHRSIGQRFVESEQFRGFLDGGGRGKSQPLQAGSFYSQHQVSHRDGMGPSDVRALVGSAGLPVDYVQPQFIPGFFRGFDLQGTLRDVLINGTTTSDAITFFRELVFTNSAAAVAEATATTGATGLKPESAITFEQATSPVVTLAHWIPITRQTLEDAAQIRTYVEQRLIDGLRLVESAQLLNGTGVGANMTGLLATTNVQDLTTAGEFTATPVADPAATNANFNRILRAKTKVYTVGRAIANFVVLNPTDIEVFLTSTDAQRQYFGAGPFGGTVLPTLWGMRVVIDENIVAKTALVGDGRMAAVWDRMQSQVLVDTINDQFVRNMLTLLAEERLALTVFRPAAFAKVQLL